MMPKRGPKTIYQHILGNAYKELVYWLRSLLVPIAHNTVRLNLFEAD